MAEVEAEIHDEEEEVPEYEKQYNIIRATTTDLRSTIESYSKRLFGTAANYKAKMELADDAPGKNAFRAIAARVTQLQKMADKLYKQQKPKAKKEPGASKHTGFNRMVLMSPKMTTFMKLADWGLLSEVNPEQGVATHGLATRYVSGYAKLNALGDAKNKTIWVADATLLELFKDEWEKESVNPKAVRYTDVQKLLKHHMSKVPEGGHEVRNADTYRPKLDDDGEFGGATKQILDLRKTLEALEEGIVKREKIFAHCKKNRPTQGITKEYAELLKTDLVQFDRIAAEVRSKAENFGFDISPNYPIRHAVPVA